MSSCSIPFIIKKCMSLPLITFVTLRSILSDISMATPASLWMLFVYWVTFHSFTLNPSPSLQLRYVYWRHIWLDFIFDPGCYSVPFYWWISSSYIWGNYWYMSIAYSHFFFCFLIAPCLLASFPLCSYHFCLVVFHSLCVISRFLFFYITNSSLHLISSISYAC